MLFNLPPRRNDANVGGRLGKSLGQTNGRNKDTERQWNGLSNASSSDSKPPDPQPLEGGCHVARKVELEHVGEQTTETATSSNATSVRQATSARLSPSLHCSRNQDPCVTTSDDVQQTEEAVLADRRSGPGHVFTFIEPSMTSNRPHSQTKSTIIGRRKETILIVKKIRDYVQE